MPLDEPPIDAEGKVVAHDHAGIADQHGVLRRISSYHLVRDEKTEGFRVSTAAFSPSSTGSRGMSVDLKESILEAGLDPEIFVISPPFLGAVSFIAGDLRQEEFQVGYEPLPENAHHGEVWGNFTKSKKKKLQEIAEIFVEPKI